MGTLDLADLTAHLPRGCALWVATGGLMAWTAEVQATYLVEHRLRILAWQKSADGQKGRNPPEPHRPPYMAHEIAAEEAKAATRAEKYLSRQRARETT